MDDLLNIARRQIGTFINMQLDEDLPEAIAEVRRLSPDVGFISSSRYLLYLDKACAELIIRRGTAVWEILYRCITNGRVEYSAGLPDRLKDVAVPFLDGAADNLAERVKEIVPRYARGTASQNAQARALETLESEIDLFCAVLSREPQATPYQPPHVINMYSSTVGNLQTGHHSVSTVTMHLPPGSIATVVAAVEELKKELQAARIEGTPVVLVNESEAELRKPRPDPSKIRSLIEAIKACVTGFLDTAPKIPAAIESVQRALEMLPPS